jgi:hypothetical protein
MNHSRRPKNPHRFERLIPQEATKSSFTFDICQSILHTLNTKETAIPVTTEAINRLQQLNETAALIRLIRERSNLNDTNTKEGYTGPERKSIHRIIATQAQALHDTLTTLDRDVFHDWCVEGLFTIENKNSFLNMAQIPDYETERQFYETVGALAKTASQCGNKPKIELSAVSGNLEPRPGIDIAIKAIAAMYTALTNEAPKTTGYDYQTKYEIFAHKCLEIMGFKGISDSLIRHMTKKSRADFSEK